MAAVGALAVVEIRAREARRVTGTSKCVPSLASQLQTHFTVPNVYHTSKSLSKALPQGWWCGEQVPADAHGAVPAPARGGYLIGAVGYRLGSLAGAAATAAGALLCGDRFSREPEARREPIRA